MTFVIRCFKELKAIHYTMHTLLYSSLVLLKITYLCELRFENFTKKGICGQD